MLLLTQIRKCMVSLDVLVMSSHVLLNGSRAGHNIVGDYKQSEGVNRETDLYEQLI